jgi:hypothetical protein
LFYFHTWIQSISTIFTLLHSLCLLSPSHWYPCLERTCFMFLSFIFKCILTVQVGFIVTFHQCIYCALLRLTYLFIIYSSSITLLPCYSGDALHHRHTQMMCFNIILYLSLFFSSLPLIPYNR